MSSKTAPDGSDGARVPFGCSWRREATGAASVQVSGELDIATAPRLEATLQAAGADARLVLLDMREVSFMDCSAVHVIVDASQVAREAGARLLLAGTSKWVDAVFEMTGMSAEVEILPLAPADEQARADRVEVPSGACDSDGGEDAPRGVERRIHPLDNLVNARVVTGRAMAIPDRGLWVHTADGAVRRAWAPQAPGLPVPAGTSVEVYFDRRGAINGWWDPRSGLAVNQRHLEPGASPATGASAACQGSCGLVWQVPAAARFAGHGERCLTCAGSLAIR